MKKNVIILTNGLSGSSVLAGLIARGGYWLGKETFKKPDYDTYENKRLVDLNKQLFDLVGYEGNYDMVFNAAEIDFFAKPKQPVDPTEYREFLAECNEHMPWIWKDPRLWLTIYFWRDMLDLDQIKFINLTRDPMQTWVSVTIRRQIQEFGYLKGYLHGIRDSIRKFLVDNNAEHIELQFEDLLLTPEKTIERLNEFLGCSLDVSDLQAVYRGELYKKPKGFGDIVKAGLIYAKNYGERYR